MLSNFGCKLRESNARNALASPPPLPAPFRPVDAPPDCRRCHRPGGSRDASQGEPEAASPGEASLVSTDCGGEAERSAQPIGRSGEGEVRRSHGVCAFVETRTETGGFPIEIMHLRGPSAPRPRRQRLDLRTRRNPDAPARPVDARRAPGRIHDRRGGRRRRPAGGAPAGGASRERRAGDPSGSVGQARSLAPPDRKAVTDRSGAAEELRVSRLARSQRAESEVTEVCEASRSEGEGEVGGFVRRHGSGFEGHVGERGSLRAATGLRAAREPQPSSGGHPDLRAARKPRPSSEGPATPRRTRRERAPKVNPASREPRRSTERSGSEGAVDSGEGEAYVQRVGPNRIRVDGRTPTP